MGAYSVVLYLFKRTDWLTTSIILLPVDLESLLQAAREYSTTVGSVCEAPSALSV